MRIRIFIHILMKIKEEEEECVLYLSVCFEIVSYRKDIS